MKSPQQLTPAEYEVIEILWDHSSPLSVSDVLQELQPKKPVAYTTVMTLLDKMARKGSLKRVKKGKAYFYRPKVGRSEVLSCLVREFADRYFDGQEEKLSAFVGGPRANHKGPPASSRRPPKALPDKPEKKNRSPSSESPPRREHQGAADLEEMDVCLL